MRNVIAAACFIYLLVPGLSIQAETVASKPGPEHETLKMLAGDWTYQGQQFDSPFAPAGKLQGKVVARLILGGFFVQANWEEENPSGKASGIDIFAYDASHNSYVQNTFVDDGTRIAGRASINGDTISTDFTATFANGDQVPLQGTWVFAPDRSSFTSTWRYSPDNGASWLPWLEYRATKVR